MLESTFREDWDEIGSNGVKKGHLLPKSTIFSKLAGCQWVNDWSAENLSFAVETSSG